ncbi:MAG TPA: glycine/sarcosine/betaine reductase selenoprotein B family protein [Symbiobacteriaceae bacterium]|jgi:D-proline reductase (dithiol) PrdB
MSLKQGIFRWYTELVTPGAAEVPFVRPGRSLQQTTVALVTTAGVRLTGQEPFDCEHGDPTFRPIPADADLSALVPDHTHYDTAAPQADISCVFPLQVLRELAAAGEIGGVAPVHFGFMGYIPDLKPLLERSIPELVQRLQAAGAGAVLLSPG